MEGKAARRKRVSPAQAGPVQQSIPLLLELPPSFAAAGRQETLREEVTDCVDRYQLRSGLAMPEVRIHFRPDGENAWALHAFEVPIVEGTVEADTDADAIVAECELALRRHGTLFLGVQETGQLLSSASVTYPDIVKEVLRSVPTQNVAAILRNLVEEEISIRNMRGILEGLLQAAQHEKDLYNLTEFARMALARQICHDHAPGGKLRAVALSPQLEQELAGQLRSAGGMQQLSLDPQNARQLRERISACLESHAPGALLTGVQLRRHVRALIARDHFDTPVLSYNELVPTLDLDIVHQISATEPTHLASVK